MAVQTVGDSSPVPSQAATAGITRILVPHEKRITFLPRVFGSRHMIEGESMVYAWMSSLCPEYRGGFWDFYDLSNGGFYLRLASDRSFAVHVDGNGFTGVMSADAASITASLFAINHLLFKGASHLDDAFYALRDYARQHEEGTSIIRAID